ncbi:ATP-binding protein [Streptomyces boluensis]|uniref:Uncharacterized protein n=1 Tax=Streptomyces boluensis TaxID=1775135 RepID=A0A964UR92_9ACTN|nr:ATP-binding protein [Streptomyces boluensis]NBE53973.1 hypothetical protein [Streptomyces boluensis]
MRAGLIERARRHGRPVVALRFLPGLAVCRARNDARTGADASRRVPDDVLAWQYDGAQHATEAALLAEGFTAAHTVDCLKSCVYAHQSPGGGYQPAARVTPAGKGVPPLPAGSLERLSSCHEEVDGAAVEQRPNEVDGGAGEPSPGEVDGAAVEHRPGEGGVAAGECRPGQVSAAVVREWTGRLDTEPAVTERRASRADIADGVDLEDVLGPRR